MPSKSRTVFGRKELVDHSNQREQGVYRIICHIKQECHEWLIGFKSIYNTTLYINMLYTIDCFMAQ